MVYRSRGHRKYHLEYDIKYMRVFPVVSIYVTPLSYNDIHDVNTHTVHAHNVMQLFMSSSCWCLDVAVKHTSSSIAVDAQALMSDL